ALRTVGSRAVRQTEARHRNDGGCCARHERPSSLGVKSGLPSTTSLKLRRSVARRSRELAVAVTYEPCVELSSLSDITEPKQETPRPRALRKSQGKGPGEEANVIPVRTAAFAREHPAVQTSRFSSASRPRA